MEEIKVHPQAAALLEELARGGGAPPIQELTPEEARKTRNPLFIRLGGTGTRLHRTEDLEIEGPGGPIPLRIYRPGPQEILPVVVYFHGGGWVICNIDTHDSLCRFLAHETETLVISVGYRLAPEHKYPAALEDAYAAIRWVHESGKRVGADPGRIAVAGDSAGGNLAAAVSLMARDRGGPPLLCQVLMYPVLNVSRLDTGTYQTYADRFILTASAMDYYRKHYARDEQDFLDPYVSPLLARDLRGLPPAFLAAAEHDVLTDEIAAYHERLLEAGVPSAYRCYEGMIHPFFSFLTVFDTARHALSDVAAHLKDRFSNAPPV